MPYTSYWCIQLSGSEAEKVITQQRNPSFKVTIVTYYVIIIYCKIGMLVLTSAKVAHNLHMRLNNVCYLATDEYATVVS